MDKQTEVELLLRADNALHTALETWTAGVDQIPLHLWAGGPVDVNPRIGIKLWQAYVHMQLMRHGVDAQGGKTYAAISGEAAS